MPNFAPASRLPRNFNPETDTMQNTPQSPKHEQHEMTPSGRSIWKKLEDLLFGKPDDKWRQREDILFDLPPFPPETGERVEKLSSSWLQAFYNALTDATAIFIRDYVEPLHAEDPAIGFSVRAIAAAFHDVNDPRIRPIAELPAEPRNRVAIPCCNKALGAKEQLEFEKFFGLNIVAGDSLVEGFLVRTLVANEGARLNVTFRFTGDYVTLKAKPAPQGAGTPEAAPVPDLPPAPASHQFAAEEAEQATPLRPCRAAEENATPLRPALAEVNKPILLVTLVENGSDTRIPIQADAFPVGIGSDPKGKTRIAVHSGRLAAPGITSFVSGQHLELVDYDAATRIVCVRNLGKNGTYLGGVALPERFTISPGSGKTLHLGGPEGEGVARLRIEAA